MRIALVFVIPIVVVIFLSWWPSPSYTELRLHVRNVSVDVTTNGTEVTEVILDGAKTVSNLSVFGLRSVQIDVLTPTPGNHLFACEEAVDFSLGPLSMQPSLDVSGHCRLSINATKASTLGTDEEAVIQIARLRGKTCQWNARLEFLEIPPNAALGFSPNLCKAGHEASSTSGTAGTNWTVDPQALTAVLTGGEFDATLTATLTAPGTRTILYKLDATSGALELLSSFSGSLPWPAQLVPSTEGLLLAVREPEKQPRRPFQLKRDIPIQSIHLFLDPPAEDPRDAESYVLAGDIRFPETDLPPISVGPDSFLTVDPAEVLILKALALRGGILELVLTGRTKQVRMGPTPDLQRPISPSYARAIYDSESWQLIAAALTILVVPFAAWLAPREPSKGS